MPAPPPGLLPSSISRTKAGQRVRSAGWDSKLEPPSSSSTKKAREPADRAGPRAKYLGCLCLARSHSLAGACRHWLNHRRQFQTRKLRRYSPYLLLQELRVRIPLKHTVAGHVEHVQAAGNVAVRALRLLRPPKYQRSRQVNAPNVPSGIHTRRPSSIKQKKRADQPKPVRAPNYRDAFA